jgi:membrane protease YdiL (CAAX protease family)
VPATGSASASSGVAESLRDPLVVSLMAVGLILLTVWLIRRITHPHKLSLQRTPGRPNHLNILWVLIPFVLAQGTAVAMIWALEGGNASTPSLKSIILTSLVMQPVLLGSSLLVARRTFRWGLRRGLGFSGRHWIYDTGRGVLGFLAVWPVTVLVLAGVIWLGMKLDLGPIKAHPLLVAVTELSVGWKALIILSAGVLAPLGEEVFYRGLCQSLVRRYTGRPWLGIVLVSALFAASHGEWQNIPSLFVLGIALGYNYERSGRLWGPIVLHMAFNAINLLLTLSGS